MNAIERFNMLRLRLAELIKLTGRFPEVEARFLEAILKDEIEQLSARGGLADTEKNETLLTEAETELNELERQLTLAAQLKGILPPPVVSLGP